MRDYRSQFLALIVSVTKCSNLIGCEQPLFMAKLAVSVRLRTFAINKLNKNVDESNCFYDFYPDMFSLDFDSLFSTVDLKFLAFCY